MSQIPEPIPPTPGPRHFVPTDVQTGAGKRRFSMTPERQAELAAFVERFGLQADNTNWGRLNRAFIHRSYRAEHDIDEDNERLEFLGDSVIGLVCTEYILRERPDSDEGVLSKLRASLVSRVMLGRVGLSLGIGRLLLLGAGEERSGGRERESTIGSTLEAVCGALYLDHPWEDLSEPIQRNVILPALELSATKMAVDYKSRLQEWTQKEYQRVPQYEVVGTEGPDHMKEFVVEVRVEGEVVGRGRGQRKKHAENDAASDALERLGRVRGLG